MNDRTTAADLTTLDPFSNDHSGHVGGFTLNLPQGDVRGVITSLDSGAVIVSVEVDGKPYSAYVDQAV